MGEERFLEAGIAYGAPVRPVKGLSQEPIESVHGGGIFVVNGEEGVLETVEGEYFPEILDEHDAECARG